MKDTLERDGLISRGDPDLATVIDDGEEAVDLILDYQRRVGPPAGVPQAFA